MTKMKFLYEKNGKNFGFIIEAPSEEECFELGIESIEKNEGRLLNYYSIEFDQ